MSVRVVTLCARKSTYFEIFPSLLLQRPLRSCSVRNCFQKTLLIVAFDTIKSDSPNFTFPQNFRALCIGIYGNSTVLLNISQGGTFPKWDSCILDWIWARSMGFLVEHLQRLMAMIWIESSIRDRKRKYFS